jgi:hypothetical protein
MKGCYRECIGRQMILPLIKGDVPQNVIRPRFGGDNATFGWVTGRLFWSKFAMVAREMAP